MKNLQSRCGRRWLVFGLLAAVGIGMAAVGLLRGGVDDVTEHLITYDRSCSSGPWGELEVSSVVTAPPIEFVKELQTVTMQREWIFPGQTAEQVEALLISGPLPRDLALRFSATAIPFGEEGTVLSPNDEDVLALTPEQRCWMYDVLYTYDENVAKVTAYYFQGKSLDDWFYGVDLSPNTRQLLEKLVFRSGSLLVFADLPILMEAITDSNEQKAVHKALCRQRSVMLHLRIADDADLFALADYWGEGWRAKDVYPLLESLQRKDGMRIIDVAHLMPPFVRRYLYTYPDPSVFKPLEADCHWTSVRFSGRPLPPEGSEASGLLDILTNKCVRVKDEELRLGDIAIFTPPNDSTIIHSAIYIAGNILFTKNGSIMRSPWTFMSIDTVKDVYRMGQGIPDVIYFRRVAD